MKQFPKIFPLLANVILIGLISYSCGNSRSNFSKRKYLSGRYIEKGSVKDGIKDEAVQNCNVLTKGKFDKEKNSKNLQAVKNKPNQLHSNQVPDNETECDEIILRNGESLMAKNVEVSKKNVSYKGCDEEFGPTYSIPVNDVFMIRYANGEKKVFEKTRKDTEEEEDHEKKKETDENKEDSSADKDSEKENKEDDPKIDVFGLIGLGCLAMGISWVLFPLISVPSIIAALVFGIISFIRINKNPDKYKGKWMFWVIAGVATAGITLSLFI